MAEQNDSHAKLANLESQQQKFEKLKMDLNDAKETNDILSSESNNLKQNLANKEQHSNELLAQVSTLKDELATTKNKLDDTRLLLENTNKTASAEHDDLLDRITILKNELNSTKNKFEETQLELEIFNETTSAERGGRFAQISFLENAMTSTRSTLDETQLELSNTRKDFEEQKSRLDEAERELSTTRQERDENSAAATTQANVSAEANARLIERIGELERELSAGILGRLMRMVQVIVIWVWHRARWATSLLRVDAELLRPGIMLKVYRCMHGSAGAK